jgi:ABC-2 type transport system permease protein
MQLLLFGYAINNDPKQLLTAVLSRDNCIFTRNFITGLEVSEYFSINKKITSEVEGKTLLQKGEVQFVITIPENFSIDLIRRNRPSILIEADATDPITSANALNAVNGILQNVIEKESKGPLFFLKSKPLAVNINVHKLYNPEGFAKHNIIPGLIGVILTITGLMTTALSLTRERERGTMENMLSMPINPVEVMIGKITPYVLIGYLQAAIIIFAAKLTFNVPLLGNKCLLMLVLLMFIICNLSIGFTISALVKNQMQAVQMTIIVFLPSIMLSGFMFPFRGMPNWAQTIGNFLPMTYFMRIIRGLMLKGSNFYEIFPNFWPLLLFMLVTSIITVKFYKKTLD